MDNWRTTVLKLSDMYEGEYYLSRGMRLDCYGTRDNLERS